MYDFNKCIDLKTLDYDELDELSLELRNKIIDSVAKNGGHLASNLGVVELTVAIHRIFDLPNDKLIFDVSHQSYVHKLLSGRGEGFEKLRHYGGSSGFQLRSESEYDFFGGGHSGTAIAAAIGFSHACKLNGSTEYAVAVVGDGSFTNGMVYEALNNASRENLRLIVILNDNEMSISENVGAMSNYISALRTSPKYYSFKRKFKKGLRKIKIIGRLIAWISRIVKNTFKKLFVKTNLFEHLGLAYMGPVDGHNIKKLEAVLREAKYLEKPVIVHVCTQKGRGYEPAQLKPDIYHSVSPFDKNVGITDPDLKNMQITSFSSCFGKEALRLASENRDIVAISAAMCDGTGLTEFKNNYQDRFFDVGIAEEFAVTFAAGLAASKKVPIVAIYSSFIQRSFDQIIHDVAIQNLHVIFAIDRAGIVAGDGITHQGIFDAAFLLTVPNMTVYAPQTYEDMKVMLNEAVQMSSPVAIRYPKGREADIPLDLFTDNGEYRYATLGNGKKISIITYGRTVENAFGAAVLIQEFAMVNVVGIKKIKPLDSEMLWKTVKDSELIIFVEEQVKHGGVSEYIISEFTEMGVTLPNVKILAIDNEMPSHADLDDIFKSYGMDKNSIFELIKQLSK